MTKLFSNAPSEWVCEIALGALPKDGSPLEDSFSLVLPGGIEHWGLAYSFPQPVEASIEASRLGEKILAEISLHGEANVPCSRCLEETSIAYRGVLRYLFTLRPTSEEQGVPESDRDGDNEVILLDRFDDKLDLAPYIWETLIVSLPAGALCAPDCKGLCPICGANRNMRDCGCKEDDTDPRLAALKSFKPEG